MKYLTSPDYKERRLILAGTFGGLSPCLVDPFLRDEAASHGWSMRHSKPTCVPDQEVKRERRSSFMGTTPNDPTFKKGHHLPIPPPWGPILSHMGLRVIFNIQVIVMREAHTSTFSR
jgi:hypothetical protein